MKSGNDQRGSCIPPWNIDYFELKENENQPILEKLFISHSTA
jgi:hypothetical protein